MSDVSMMQPIAGDQLKFIGFPANRHGRGKRVRVARCTGGSADFGYIEVARGQDEIFVHLDRAEIDDVITALTAVRDSIPAVCKECGQVKPS